MDILNDTMPRRRLGKMPHEASVFTLGGVKWDTQIPEADAIALIHRALELGVNTFDTAAGYGNGKSEMRLGMALAGHRQNVWIATKTGNRARDAARKDFDASLQRLKTDHIDIMFIHAVDNDADVRKILGPNSVLAAMEEYRAAGHIRYLGISAHHYRADMMRLLQAYRFDAVLFPAGVFNLAYNYNFVDVVGPLARSLGMAVLGMKVLGAGRAKHAVSVEPYLRYSFNQNVDSCVIGCDSIAQLEQIVRVAKGRPQPLSLEEQKALYPECLRITQQWDPLEYNWVKHYQENPLPVTGQ